MDTGTFCSFYFLDSERDHDNGGGLKPAMTFVLLRVPYLFSSFFSSMVSDWTPTASSHAHGFTIVEHQRANIE